MEPSAAFGRQPSAERRAVRRRVCGLGSGPGRMKLALDKWEPAKPLVPGILGYELATGAEAVYHLCELAREGENPEGGRPPK